MPAKAWGRLCMSTTTPAGAFALCMSSVLNVDGATGPDPNAVPGEAYSNYLGTFCHKGYASRWSACRTDQTADRPYK